MTDLSWPPAGAPSGETAYPADRPFTPGLADVLERVLDKGIVIAGDIKVNLLDIELLTIRIRLLVASVDKAREMGIDWWEHDPSLSGGERDLAQENRALRARLAELQAAGDGAARGADEDERDATTDRGGGAT